MTTMNIDFQKSPSSLAKRSTCSKSTINKNFKIDKRLNFARSRPASENPTLGT